MTTSSSPDYFQSIGKTVFDQEIDAIKSTKNLIDEGFANACKLLISCTGKIILMGIGKSGHIAQKIAATFASTGTPAFFVHPAEALHGDLGMITEKDIVIAISHSGTTSEILALVPYLVRFNIPLISITGNKNSPLSEQAHIALFIDTQNQEACPLNLAPTSSTTATLVLGDALAVSLLKARGFQEKDFAQFHPAGALGKKLLLTVDAIMHEGKDLPRVSSRSSIQEAILEITHKRLGMTTVCSPSGILEGVFTDGDLRRAFEKNIDITNTPIQECMTQNPKTMKTGDLAIKAAQLMQKFRITAIPVLDEEGKTIGIVHLHDLLGSGVI
jgi:arabinose-5-phosphate isomerase